MEADHHRREKFQNIKEKTMQKLTRLVKVIVCLIDTIYCFQLLSIISTTLLIDYMPHLAFLYIMLTCSQTSTRCPRERERLCTCKELAVHMQGVGCAHARSWLCTCKELAVHMQGVGCAHARSCVYLCKIANGSPPMPEVDQLRSVRIKLQMLFLNSH